MADVQANIELITTGGDQAASEINKATVALGSMTAASSGLEGQFQHRFQHIGLMLFAGDALRASGLGRETRMVVSAMNLAIAGGAEAAGIASGGVLLLVTALIALAGIAVKVIQHHKDEAEALEKQVDAQSKANEGYRAEIDALDKLAENGGKLTPILQAWHDADERVAEGIQNRLLVTLKDEEAALLKQQAALQSTADMQAHFREVLDAVRAAFLQLLGPFIAVNNQLAAWASALTKIIPATESHVTLTGKLKDEFDALGAKIAKVRGEEELLATTGSIDLKKLSEEAIKNAKDREAAEDRVTTFQKAKLKEVHDAYSAAYTARVKEAEASFKKEEAIVAQSVSRVGSDFGNAFAKMLVEGKSFTEEMSKAFTAMAEQIISEIVKMILEWSIFSAMSGFGGPVGAFGAAGLKGLGFATGGSAMVDSPTMFMAGEAGPELVNVSPLMTGGAGNGGGQTINIGTVATTVSGVNNPDAIARQVGQKIVEEIRGRGQINFTRA